MKKNLLILSLIALPALGFGQVLLNEDFESGTIPSTWSVQQTNPRETWYVGEGVDSFVATVDYDEDLEDQNEWFITPSLDFTPTRAAYVLTFDLGMSYYWGVDPNNNYDVYLKVSTDNGATWTQIWSEDQIGEFENWTLNPVRIDVSQFQGQDNVKFAFQYVGADGAAVYLDNVKVEGLTELPQAPGCVALITPENGATGVDYMSGMGLSWEAASPVAATGYNVYFGNSASTLNLLGSTAGTAVSITNGSPDTTYYWQIAPKNDIGVATGCEVRSFTTGSSPFAPYCGPLSFTYVEAITNVTFAGINNTTPVDSEVSHESFLDQTAQVVPGETYTVTLKGSTEGNYKNRFVVFIDWNQNGTFDETEKYSLTDVLENSTGVDSKYVSMDITVPADAIPGNTRMRVKKTYGATVQEDPCVVGSSFGQAEDYSVNVGSLSITDITKTKVQAYPNPVVDYLTVTSAKDIQSIAVVDVTGRKVLASATATKENKVDMTSMPAGTYVVSVDTEEGTQTFKVIKK